MTRFHSLTSPRIEAETTLNIISHIVTYDLCATQQTCLCLALTWFSNNTGVEKLICPV